MARNGLGGYQALHMSRCLKVVVYRSLPLYSSRHWVTVYVGQKLQRLHPLQ